MITKMVYEKMDVLVLHIPSDLSFIHKTVRKVEQFLSDHGMENKWKVSVVMWELLSNAITHGNRSIPTREVTCQVSYTQEGIVTIIVEDEGSGFDYRHLDSTFPEIPQNIQKRGFVLIYSICSSVSFNEQGNRVTAVLDTCESP